MAHYHIDSNQKKELLSATHPNGDPLLFTLLEDRDAEHVIVHLKAINDSSLDNNDKKELLLAEFESPENPENRRPQKYILKVPKSIKILTKQ